MIFAISWLSVVKYYSVVRLYHNLFMHSSVDRQMVFLQFSPVFDYHGKQLLCTFMCKFLDECMFSFLLGCMVNGFNCIRNRQPVFQSGTSLAAPCESFSCCTSYPKFGS